MSDSNSTDHQHDDEMTQGENPGAQGDIGAGQGNPGDDPVVSDPEPAIVGVEQPRRDETLGDDDGGTSTDQFGDDQRNAQQI